MRATNLLILNSAVTYLRMAITVGMGLAVTRFALDELGDANYGIFMVLGGGGALFLILSDALSLALQRHVAYDLGAKDDDALKRTTSTANAMFLAVALAVFTACWLFADTIVEILTIPEERQSAAAGAFVFVAAQLCTGVIATPAKAVLIAKQSIALITVYDLGQSVMRFAAVLVLVLFDHADPLLAFAKFVFLGTIPTTLFAIVAAWRAVPPARFSPRAVGLAHARRILSFASWSVLASLAWRLRLQGSQVLLNLAFGPVVNSAYGVAVQIAGYQNSIAFAMRRAAYPAVITQHGADNPTLTKSIALSSSKFLTLAMGIVAVPIAIDPQSALELWLKDVPPGATVFVPLVATSVLLAAISDGHSMAIHATGRIKLATLWSLATNLGSLIIAAVPIFFFGAPAWTLPAVAVGTSATLAAGRAFLFRKQVDIPFRRWLGTSFLPAASVLVAAAALALIPRLLLDEGPLRFAAVTGVSVSAIAILALTRALSSAESARIKAIARAALARVAPHKNTTPSDRT